jgi:hypothetical protein
VALLIAAPAAQAAGLDMTLDAMSGGYKKQTVDMTDVAVIDGGTLAIQQNDVNVMMRSGGDDKVRIRATTRSLGYHDQKVRMQDVEVNGGAALAVQQGVLGVIMN